MRLERVLCVAVGLGACVGTPAPPPPPDPRVMAVAELPAPTDVVVWPQVALIPANAVTLRVSFGEPVTLGGHEFAVFRVDGERAVEVVGALERWYWNGERTEVRVEPQGLETGPPYRLAGMGLVTDSGRAIPTFGHPFRVIPADVVAPDGAGVRVLGDPQPGTSAALRIPFDEPVQREAVRKVAALAGGVPHPGEWRLVDGQRVLEFTPAAPWGDGLVTVAVNAGIRDLSGNELTNRPRGMLVPMVPVEP